MSFKSQANSICFISPFIAPLLNKNDSRGTGGAERQFYLFGKELAKRGWDISYILKNEKSLQDAVWPDWCNVYPVNFGYLGGNNLNVLPGIVSFWHAMLKSKSQFYAVKTPAFLLLPMIILGKLLKRKIIFWSQIDHDSEKKRESVTSIFSRIQNACLQRVDFIISQTQKQALGYQNNMSLESTVISSIASIDEIDCLNSESDYLLWVGNSSPKKRQEVFVELARLLPDQKCVMAMNLACRERFDAARQDAEKIKNLTFLGSIKPAETQKWFKHACIYVHTATKEGFPNTFLQAWSNGVPVVSLNIDPDGQINKKILGKCIGSERVAEYDDNPRKLAELLVPIVKHYRMNPSFRKKVGLNATEYVSKIHSPAVVIDNLIKVLLKND